jgi:hypothetical protein
MSRSLAPSFARFVAMPVAVALIVAGCVSSGAGSPGAPAASASPAESSSPDAIATPAGPPSTGFYLRAWQTQALAPQNTFGWLPVATVADGQYIDGRVAIPMVYPGPIYIGLSARSISATGTAAIAAEARTDGLLGATSDFSAGAAPGSILGHIELIVDGVTHDLTGPLPSDASTSAAAPGTAAAFAAFWNRIGTVGAWLAADLGPSQPYSPTSLAVLLAPPADASSGLASKEVPWPLATPFAAFGQSFGGSVYRCATVTGADLTSLLPVVKAANALTRFTDSTGTKISLQAGVLVPGEPSPCS